MKFSWMDSADKNDYDKDISPNRFWNFRHEIKKKLNQIFNYIESIIFSATLPTHLYLGCRKSQRRFIRKEMF